MIMDGMPHAEYDSTKGVEVFLQQNIGRKLT